MRHARRYSTLEQHDVITAEHIRGASREDIVRFLRDFRGGSWVWLRSRPRAELEAMATKTAETWNAPGGGDDARRQDGT